MKSAMWFLQTGQRQSEPGISLSLEERDMRRTWQTHWIQDAGVVSIAFMVSYTISKLDAIVVPFHHTQQVRNFFSKRAVPLGSTKLMKI